MFLSFYLREVRNLYSRPAVSHLIKHEPIFRTGSLPSYITSIHWALAVCQSLMQMLRLQRWTSQKSYHPSCPYQLSLPFSNVAPLHSPACIMVILPLYWLAHTEVTDRHLDGVVISPDLPSSTGYCGLPLSSWNLSHFLKYHTPSWFFSFLLAFSSYSPTHWAIKCGFSSGLGLFCGQSPSSNLSSKGFPKSLTYHLYAYQPPTSIPLRWISLLRTQASWSSLLETSVPGSFPGPQAEYD